ncbi:MAG: leucyl aminopeptidase [Ktedonobacteraceae bacterium]|nr:leucyl aminopeptidase [Ktedonobacteraceae bacterium]
MKIQVTTQKTHDILSDALVVAAARKPHVSGGDEKSVQLSPAAAEVDALLNGLIIERCADGEFRGNAGEMLTIHPIGRLAVKRVLVIGLGKQENVTSQSIRHASAVAARHLQRTGARHITLALQWNAADAIREAQAQTEGALLGLYTFRAYQSRENGENRSRVEHIDVLAANQNPDDLARGIQKGQILAEATNFARDLVNEPPNVLTPTELANRAVALAQQSGLEYEVLDREKIAALGMGGLLGVSQGSAEPPRFIILRYRGAPDSGEKGIALVGKGITFDTGGISLKPAANMDEMKGDMGGAAAVLGAMRAIAALKPAINVTALIPTCENMPSGTAYHPGDILRIMNGKTIEIVNTDAEGRLILADALSYAAREGLSPIIDLATLTGAIVVALGHITTGLFSNDQLLTDEIIAAGRSTGEKFWPLPMDEEYGELIKSDIADIKQTGGRPAGSIAAAKILEQFVGNARWAHLDIAGTSYLDSQKPYREKGATGVGVRTLAEFVLNRVGQ